MHSITALTDVIALRKFQLTAITISPFIQKVMKLGGEEGWDISMIKKKQKNFCLGIQYYNDRVSECELSKQELTLLTSAVVIGSTNL